ncbi:MAG TPA: molybdenum cofactor guanylyltransferase MobA [Stellaceae bacterium]|nr:molybdenum cofactor guanylyltransferase MobA [Stellaceae bacterium]
MKVAGVILAGGQSRRMGGGDKCLRALGGRPILSWIIARAMPQVDRLALNANGDPARFAAFGLPVIPDGIAGFPGPLAGVLAGLDWASGYTHLVTFAADAPFFPLDLVARFKAAIVDGRHDLACAASDGRAHPVFGIWEVRLREDLRRAMVEEGVRKVDQWTARHRLIEVEFSSSPTDPFFNANHPEDLVEAESMRRAHPEVEL